MDELNVQIPLKRFILLTQCPSEWRNLDLYLFRDDATVFYVGQSYLAYDRVWEHLLNGFKGHSIMGHFVWCNWPRSMNFCIELFASKSVQFEAVGNDLNEAERLLIQRWMPCFNASLNDSPASLPAQYFPPNAQIRRRRTLNALIHEAERAVQLEDTKLWMQGLTE